MVLDSLSESLKNTLNKITKSLFVDEKLINELAKDIQRALLQADVNVKLVFDLTEKIKNRALSEEAPKGLTKKEQLINIVYGELVNFLGKEQKKIEIKDRLAASFDVSLFLTDQNSDLDLGKFLVCDSTADTSGYNADWDAGKTAANSAKRAA